MPAIAAKPIGFATNLFRKVYLMTPRSMWPLTPVTSSGSYVRLHAQQAGVESISDATLRAQINLGASSGLAKVEVSTQRPKNAGSLGHAPSENRSGQGNGTLGSVSRHSLQCSRKSSTEVKNTLDTGNLPTDLAIVSGNLHRLFSPKYGHLEADIF
jgi:hypothetical protein